MCLTSRPRTWSLSVGSAGDPTVRIRHLTKRKYLPGSSKVSFIAELKFVAAVFSAGSKSEGKKSSKTQKEF